MATVQKEEKERSYEWLLNEKEKEWMQHLHHSPKAIIKQYKKLKKNVVYRETMLNQVPNIEAIKQKHFEDKYPQSNMVRILMEKFPLKDVLTFVKPVLQYYQEHTVLKATTVQEIYPLWMDAWYNSLVQGWNTPIPEGMAPLLKLQAAVNDAEWKVESFKKNIIDKRKRLDRIATQVPRYIDPDIVYAMHNVIDNQKNDKRYAFQPIHKKVLGFVFPIEIDDEDTDDEKKKPRLLQLRASTEVSYYQQSGCPNARFVLRRTNISKSCLDRDVAVIDEDGTVVFRDFSLADDVIHSFEMLVSAVYNNNFNYGMRMIGKKYGMCMHCGRQLTDAQSIEFGFGSTCARYYGYNYGMSIEEESRRLEKHQKNQ